MAVAFFGDGAVNNGAFHEGLNMASIWKLPVLFVCENNQFATEVPFAYAAGNPSVANRGASYGMPGVDVDGNDVLAVYQAAGEAVDRARSGDGPTLLECRTYRTRPHAEGMGDYTYRTRDEVEAWKTRCPIAPLPSLDHRSAGRTGRPSSRPSSLRSTRSSTTHSSSPKPAPGPTPTRRLGSCSTNPSWQSDDRPRLAPDRASVASPDTARADQLHAGHLEGLAEEMARDPSIFVMGEGIGKRGGNFKTTAGLYDLYGPVRLRDTPICERGFVGLGCGAAMTGTRPVIDFMFADFVLDSVGEIINQIAKIQYMSSGRLKMPILLRGCIGIGHSAATHHSGNYYPMYAHFPGLRVVVPSTPYDAKGLLKQALRCSDPVIFLEHRELLAFKGPVPDGRLRDRVWPGRGRPRRDATSRWSALALMVHQTQKICEQLAEEGISVELIDPRTVAPLDIETIRQSVAKTGRLLIVDEAFAPFGIGAEIAARLADQGFDDLDAPIRRLNGAFTPTPYSPTLEAAVVPNPESIAQAIRDLMAE